MATDNHGYRITDEERDFLFDKAKEIDKYCEQRGISLIRDIKGLHAFRTPQGGFDIDFIRKETEKTRIPMSDFTRIPMEAADGTDDLSDSAIVPQPA